MIKFTWYDAFVYDPIKRRISRKILREQIKKYGVNTRDKGLKYVYQFVTLIHFNLEHEFTKLVDVIFEFRPNIFPNKIIDCHYSYNLFIFDNYMLKKALEQDVNYEYIHYRFRWVRCDYRNIAYLIASGDISEYELRYNDVNYGYVKLFIDHYRKGITFFELMKFKLLDK